MASVSVLNPPWKNAHPAFHEMVIQSLGELQCVDEFDVPFWEGKSHVLIKQNHPLFRREAQDALLKRVHTTCQEDGGRRSSLFQGHLHTIQQTLDLFNSNWESWQNASNDEEWRVALAKQPIRLPKDLYNHFKISCCAVGNTHMPVSNW